MCNPTVASDEKTPTGSPCLPFHLNSKTHSPILETVISGWHSQQFAYPEDKPCSPCPEVISGLQQRSNMKFSWLLSQQEFYLLGEKTMKLRLPEGFPCIQYCTQALFAITLLHLSVLHSHWVFVMIHSSFKQLEFGSEIDFWVPALILTDL